MGSRLLGWRPVVRDTDPEPAPTAVPLVLPPPVPSTPVWSEPATLGGARRGVRWLFGAVLGGAVAASGSNATADGSSETPGTAPGSSPITASAFYARKFSKKPSPEALAVLGRRLFFARSLSASGKLACSSCHDPKFAYGPPNALAVQAGGAHMQGSGLRAVPALRYTQAIPPFTEHYSEEDQGIDQGPAGGRTWDGRADTVHDQARLPLFSRLEMANESAAALLDRLQHSSLGPRFRSTFGKDVFTDRALAFKGVLLALEVFQQSPREFYPYSSRYDEWLRGKAQLSAREQRGLSLFNDPQKGNCAHCHPSQLRGGVFPAFSDFGFNALGVPRNRAIPAAADPSFHDLGLCGPERTGFAHRREYCGLFRVPSLRNVAVRRSFFHNGVFHDLRHVLEFYVQRDLSPEKWYARDASGKPLLYDDLPAEYHENVSHEPPFDRAPGAAPALSEAEIGDVIAFLKTLTDADLVQK
jgi:cytochrome c peroxidase